MYKCFLALVCAAMVWLGCTPIVTYQCRGGESGAKQWHTIEARGLDAARENNGFADWSDDDPIPTQRAPKKE